MVEKIDALKQAKEYYEANLPFYVRNDFKSCYAHKLYSWQMDFLLNRKLLAFLTAANQIGKDIECDARIPTPDGWRRYGDLVTGDMVFGGDGKPTRILATKHFQNQECYRITFDDGASIVAGAGHLWMCKGYKERFRKRYKNTSGKVWDNETLGNWIIRSTEEIMVLGGYRPEAKAMDRHSIPISQAVEYPEKDLFDPYLVGLLLGDGTLTTRAIMLSCGDPEPIEYVTARYRTHQSKVKKIDYCIKDIADEIEKIGLLGTRSGTKFIPEQYLVGSIEQRKALFAGLMDTDGSCYGKGILEYSSVSLELSKNVVTLVRSLGGKAELFPPKSSSYKTKDGTIKTCQDVHRVFIKTLFNPFTIERKRERWYETRYKHERIIYKIESVPSVSTMCITVDNADSTYLIGDDYIVTHNSSIQIIRALNQAMRQDLWPFYFPNRHPKTFLYLYPESKLATTEWHEKWVKSYMPRGKMVEDHRYGWKANYDNKKSIESVKFASGVTIYFRNYSQSPHSLQAISADAVFLDEETPEAHFDELLVRSQARQAEGSGYVSMCFTATLGQLYLYKCMEMQGTDQEMFVGAWKRQVSAFDCLRYADGTHSGLWTKKFIENELIPKYRTAAEVQKRIYGRFIKTGGLLYEDFDMDRNTEACGATDVTGWSTYVGIDFGSGGEYGHSSTIVITKVDPSYTKARVVKSWSSKKQRMTQADLLVQYQMMTSAYEDVIAYADWSATDFFEFAARESVPINKAEKSHDLGVNLLNMVFRDGQLKLWIGDEAGDNGFLIQEIRSISQDTPKNKRLDDLADALRYSLSLCPLRVTSNFEPPVKREEKRENTRLLFYEGRDGRQADPMLQEDNDIMMDFDEAVRMYEDLL